MEEYKKYLNLSENERYSLPFSEWDIEYNVRRNIERIDKELWVSPEGKSVKLPEKDEFLMRQIPSFHSEIADLILPDVKDSQTALLNLGWLMVGSTVYGTPIIHKDPTQSQIDFLFDNRLINQLYILRDGFYVKYYNK